VPSHKETSLIAHHILANRNNFDPSQSILHFTSSAANHLQINENEMYLLGRTCAIIRKLWID